MSLGHLPSFTHGFSARFRAEKQTSSNTKTPAFLNVMGRGSCTRISFENRIKKKKGKPHISPERSVFGNENPVKISKKSFTW
jgi:hypothetical protein